MKIILTDDVVGLGDIGELVSVKPGYARNFLIPRGLAIESQSASAKETEHRKRQIDAKKKRLKGVAENRAQELKKIQLTFELRVGAHGKVFGSLHAKDIAAKLAEHGYELDRRRVVLTEPIRKLGDHTVRVRLHQEVETEVKISVIARESTTEEEAKDVETARQNIEDAKAERDAEQGDEDEAGDEE